LTQGRTDRSILHNQKHSSDLLKHRLHLFAQLTITQGSVLQSDLWKFGHILLSSHQTRDGKKDEMRHCTIPLERILIKQPSINIKTHQVGFHQCLQKQDCYIVLCHIDHFVQLLNFLVVSLQGNSRRNSFDVLLYDLRKDDSQSLVTAWDEF
jgi:hypothetical protein